MTNIYEINKNYSLLLYTNEKNIYLRYKNAENIGRQILLTNHYSHGISSCCDNGVVFYAFFNINKQLLVKSTKSWDTIFVLDFSSKEDNLFYQNPFLCICQNELMLFYIDSNPYSAKYELHYVFPLHPEKAITLGYPFLSMPSFSCTICRDYLFLNLVHNHGKSSFIMNEAFDFIPLSENIKPSDDQQKDHTITLLTKKLSLANEQMEAYQKIIQDDKYQYHDLLCAAEHYKQEANKWKNKISFSSSYTEKRL